MLGSKSENYGRYRMGGSVGYILAASTSGFIYDRTGLSLIFPVYGVMMGLFALTALLLPDIPVRLEKRAAAQIGRMMRQPAWMVFAASIFLIWVANYASIMYQGVALLSMGASQSLIGLASTSGAIVEIPFLFFSGWFIRRAGLTRLLIVVDDFDDDALCALVVDAFTGMGIFYQYSQRSSLWASGDVQRGLCKEVSATNPQRYFTGAAEFNDQPGGGGERFADGGTVRPDRGTRDLFGDGFLLRGGPDPVWSEHAGVSSETGGRSGLKWKTRSRSPIETKFMKLKPA